MTEAAATVSAMDDNRSLPEAVQHLIGSPTLHDSTPGWR
jgi:hypothetical protein